MGDIYTSSPVRIVDEAGVPVSEGGADTVGGQSNDNSPSVGKPVPVGGIYNSATQVYDSGDRTTLQTDVNGNLKTVFAASEVHVGQVGGTTEIINTTPTLDTAIYASGDVLFDTVVVTNAMRVADKLGILQSITVLDEDDQGVALDLIFFSTSRSIGTINAAPTLTDADARDILAVVSFLTTDYSDLGGCRIATRSGLGLAMRPAAGTRNVFVAGVLRTGTPTFTAAGIKLRCGFLQD